MEELSSSISIGVFLAVPTGMIGDGLVKTQKCGGSLSDGMADDTAAKQVALQTTCDSSCRLGFRR